MMCEKCWADAYLAAQTLGGSQAEHYNRIVRERDAEESPCTPEERAGQFWDAANQRDMRREP
jgi:hypothetical protein